MCKWLHHYCVIVGPEQPEVPWDARAVSRRWADDWWRHHQPQCILYRHDNRGRYMHMFVNLERKSIILLYIMCALFFVFITDSKEHVVPWIRGNDDGGSVCIIIHRAWNSKGMVPKVQLQTDSCFGLIGPHQRSAALGGPSHPSSRRKAPMGFKAAKSSKAPACISTCSDIVLSCSRKKILCG